LGKWLKAAMLLRVREKFPQIQVVVTDNATSNAAMLSINERLGFRPHKEGVWAQITLEALEDYLRK
ncbi:MAG: N-acetyltransferase, partial [Thermoplasmata archaeon]